MRLDHLLSKEHHERHLHSGGVSREESARCSGGGFGAQQTCPRWGRLAGRGRESLNTLLGCEATGPRSRTWFGERVVALSWWWGVVFDLWIVVASIMPARVSSLGGAGVG